MPALSTAEIIEQHLDELFGYEDVAGVGEGELDGKPCIKIFLTRENDRTRLALPEALGGHPVVVEISGSFSRL